jgi:ABC-type amino acid transport system permease subunit
MDLIIQLFALVFGSIIGTTIVVSILYNTNPINVMICVTKIFIKIIRGSIK